MSPYGLLFCVDRMGVCVCPLVRSFVLVYVRLFIRLYWWSVSSITLYRILFRRHKYLLFVYLACFYPFLAYELKVWHSTRPVCRSPRVPKSFLKEAHTSADREKACLDNSKFLLDAALFCVLDFGKFVLYILVVVENHVVYKWQFILDFLATILAVSLWFAPMVRFNLLKMCTALEFQIQKKKKTKRTNLKKLLAICVVVSCFGEYESRCRSWEMHMEVYENSMEKYTRECGLCLYVYVYEFIYGLCLLHRQTMNGMYTIRTKKIFFLPTAFFLYYFYCCCHTHTTGVLVFAYFSFSR